MAYEKQTWVDQETRITAARMLHMEDGISDVDGRVQELEKSSGSSAELTIGTVTSGQTASASIVNGKLNLVLPKGETGATGATGAQGAKGDKGDTGAAGAKGADGAAGAKGDKGDPGEGFTDTAKTLILSLFEGAAYGNASMQSQLDALKTEWGSSGGGTTVPVTSISLSKTTLSLQEGGSETLTATVTPSNATTQTVTWSVSPSGYATVSGGKVTAVKAGSCTITASCGGKIASCAVTVTAAAEAEDVPGETPVYKLAQATEFTPSKAQCIDTGIQMLKTIDPKPTYTILFEVKGGESLTAVYDSYVLMHCMEESSPWPGFVVQIAGSSGLQLNIYGYKKALITVDQLKASSRRFAVQFADETIKVWNYDGNYLTGGSTINSYTTAVSKSLLLGCYQTSDGVKGRYFDGTLYQCLVYDKALTNSQVVKWITG